MIIAMTGEVQICPDASCRLQVDGKRITPATLTGEAQRIQSSVVVQVAHGECCDLRTT